MKNDFLFQEQLDKFEEVFCSSDVINEFKELKATNPSRIPFFEPTAAESLYDHTPNTRYLLTGKNIFGIIRKWKLVDNVIKNGISLNSGQFQLDKTVDLNSILSNIFVEANSKDELLQNAKKLFSLSNEDIIREYNITMDDFNMSRLFNAIIADSIIDYQIENNTFEGYGYCKADFSEISIKSARVYNSDNSGIIKLPNNERITFKLNFSKENNNRRFGIDDLQVETTSIVGNSELLQRVLSQLDRFSIKNKEQNNNLEQSPLQQRKEQLSLLEAEAKALSEELRAEQTKKGQDIGEE